MAFVENCCGLEAGVGKENADCAPCPKALDIPKLIEELDGLYASGRESEAQIKLEQWLKQAREGGDWRGELSLLSELLGQYRRSMSREKGLKTVDEVQALIKEHGMENTVSGATVLLNAATTLKCFGQAARSLPIFLAVSRVYGANLDPEDYRFAGLYNNMALSYSDAGDYENAERCFLLALKVIRACPNPHNDVAVTLCNMAEMYDRQDPEDKRIEACMEEAWAELNDPGNPRDGYHAFTVSKCESSFRYFGYFLYAKELKERGESIYAGAK